MRIGTMVSTCGSVQGTWFAKGVFAPPIKHNGGPLAAFVDGEMTPEAAAEVVMHLADHPLDQAYVDDLMAANEALAKAFAGPMSEQVPPRILAAIEGWQSAGLAAVPSTVIPFRRRPVMAFGGLALAALASRSHAAQHIATE